MSIDNKCADLLIFDNHKKTQSRHPDYTGTFTYTNGEKIYLSLWKRKSQGTGTEFISGYASPPYEGPPHEEQKSTNSNTSKVESAKPAKRTQLDDLDF